MLKKDDGSLPCSDSDIAELLIPDPFVHRDNIDVKSWHSSENIKQWTFDYDETNLSNILSHTTLSGWNHYNGPLDHTDKDNLLQLIRHATSDIQRDFRLAAASILCIAVLRCCNDDVEYLRNLIGVISTDDFPALCYGHCFDGSLNHNCQDVS